MEWTKCEKDKNDERAKYMDAIQTLKMQIVIMNRNPIYYVVIRLSKSTVRFHCAPRCLHASKLIRTNTGESSEFMSLTFKVCEKECFVTRNVYKVRHVTDPDMFNGAGAPTAVTVTSRVSVSQKAQIPDRGHVSEGGAASGRRPVYVRVLS